MKTWNPRRHGRSTAVAVGLILLGVASSAVAQTPPRIASTSSSGDSGKLTPAIRVAQSSLASARKLTDYEAAFTKRELINNQMIFHTTQIKLRHRPFSVYMRFLGQHEGREVLYVQGRNDGEMLAHDTGIKSIVGTVSVNPNGRRALEESRYPITKMGLVNLVETVIEQWQKDAAHDDVELKYYPQAKLGNLECKVIETSHRTPKRGVQFQTTRLYIDRSSNLPVRIEQYGFSNQAGKRGPLIEEYTYSNIRPNRKLTDFDFDPRNQEYAF